MKSIIIMYLPGHAGNFLARLFSLGEDVMPQLPVKILSQAVNSIQWPSIGNRVEFYSFGKVFDQYRTWQDFHSAWTDFYDNWLFQIASAQHNDRWSAAIYSMHPHEFVRFKREIVDNHSEIFVVRLDSKYESWVFKAQRRLKFVYREMESEQYYELQQQIPMHHIDLGLMLDSDQGFENEYLRVCGLMKLEPKLKEARALYLDWRSARVDNYL